MQSVTVAINDLFEFEGQPIPAQQPDHAIVEAMARRQFGFLFQPIQIEIRENFVTVSFFEESEAARDEAARLASKAGKRATEGEFGKAISIWKRVLELQPSLHKARRDLAMAYAETSDVENAKNHLIEVLRLKPDDTWSWVVLGNLYAKDPKDTATAERFFRRALELAPNDPWALNALAVITARGGDTEAAIALFQQAISANPEVPNAYHGLAVTYHRTNRPDLVISALDDLFKNAQMQDARSRATFDQARTLYAEAQAALVPKQNSAAFKSVENLRLEMEQASGYPVQIAEGEFSDLTGATIQTAWRHGRDHHLIRCRTGVSEELRTHLIAHELTHLRLECAARSVRKNRFFTGTTLTEEVAMRRIHGDLQKLRKHGYSDESSKELATTLIRGLSGFLFNCPLDMIIETELRNRMPDLSAVQFVSLRATASEVSRLNASSDIQKVTPSFIFRASVALNGAYALFLDKLYHGATNYAASYQRLESFGLSQRLFRHWEDRFPRLGHGDEYALVDEFAEMLGMRGWFEWTVDSGNHEVTEAPLHQGASNPDLLRTKQPAAVHYFLDALRRYNTLSVEEVHRTA